MLKRCVVLFGIILAIILLSIAASYYPGGSQRDKNSIGYDWKNNYLSNLFSDKAVNGLNNTSRPWAVGGMFFLCLSFAISFSRVSKKISSKGAAMIVKYCGMGAMLFAFLAVTPYHDLMVALSGTCILISMFYITVFLFRSKLLFLKILCIFCLLTLYCCNYIYYTRNYLELLPIVQKITLLAGIIWILCLEYFTTPADFEIKKNNQ